MIHTIQNNDLEVRVSNTGAELQNIIKKKNNVEYLWQGNPTHWGRRSPVLFPIVGAVKEGTILIQGKPYPMGQHGFARNMDFSLQKVNDKQLIYVLKSTTETRKQFPLDFELFIGYRLNQNKLTTEYKVLNPGSDELIFSIGAHPAFNCPINSGKKRSDYKLVLNKPEIAHRQLIDGGIRNGITRLILDDQSEISITDDLFDEDALIFDNLSSNAITIREGEEPVLTMNFEGFPYFGIWSMSPESPFVCLEPWFGIADHKDHNQNFLEKEGVIRLKSGESFQSEYHIVIH